MFHTLDLKVIPVVKIQTVAHVTLTFCIHSTTLHLLTYTKVFDQLNVLTTKTQT